MWDYLPCNRSHRFLSRLSIISASPSAPISQHFRRRDGVRFGHQRSPISTTLYGGEPPSVGSERHRDSAACSCSRPASVGGMAPVPGANSLRSIAFMSAV